MVNQLVIPIHSVVDIITNSSTVIYTGTQDSAKSAIRNIINHILEQAGSDKEALDLYDIKVVGTGDMEIDDLLDQRGIYYKYPNYNEEYKKLENELGVAFEQIKTEFADSGAYPKSSLVVTPKNDAQDDYVTQMLGMLFYVEEGYN